MDIRQKFKQSIAKWYSEFESAKSVWNKTIQDWSDLNFILWRKRELGTNVIYKNSSMKTWVLHMQIL